MVSLTIDNSINDTLSFKNIVIYVSLALVLLLNVLMLVYCFKSNELIKSKLVDLLYYSDGEIRLFQQNADNMKYAIEMTRKHYDVDTQNLLTKTNSCAKRKNPK